MPDEYRQARVVRHPAVRREHERLAAGVGRLLGFGVLGHMRFSVESGASQQRLFLSLGAVQRVFALRRLAEISGRASAHSAEPDADTY
ncbi:hypothetical protein [Caballeronia sp. Sq4a]|uniref:hypothetical protein n=1 Tax=Caballeronia sp. Sq4a TaxID=2878152 RepID=UPI0020BD8562|nr:hypothetical protein [Caballeronia sp. Sq4a]